MLHNVVCKKRIRLAKHTHHPLVMTQCGVAPSETPKRADARCNELGTLPEKTGKCGNFSLPPVWEPHFVRKTDQTN